LAQRELERHSVVNNARLSPAKAPIPLPSSIAFRRALVPWPTILHLIPAGGGGTERFARDLTMQCMAYRHLLLHVGTDSAALEDVQSRKFAGLKRPDTPSFARFASGLIATYQINVVHLHYVGADALEWIEWLAAQSVTLIVSLHDLGFSSPQLFAAATCAEPPVDPAWTQRLRAMFARAQGVTAPSDFLAQRFSEIFPGVKLQVIAPGISDVTPILKRRLATRPTVGLIGAFGAHKGSELAEAVWKLDAAKSIRWVLIGYTENHLFPAHTEDPEIIVHGPFEVAEAATLIDDYDIDLMWFPNRLAESFSYALSESWAAARPALVPAHGALGERVRIHGGGWIAHDSRDAARVLEELVWALEQSRDPSLRAELDARRADCIPRLPAMAAAFQSIYARIAMSPVHEAEVWSTAEVQAFLETQLGALTFRQENVRLARDYGQVRVWADKLENSVREVGEDRDRWIAAFDQQAEFVKRLSQSVSEVQAELKSWVDRAWLAEAQIGQLSAEQAHLSEKLRVADAQIVDLQTALSAQTQRAEAATAWGVELDRRLLVVHTELAHAQTQIADLHTEIAPLRIKGHRYDRVLSWVPSSLKQIARRLAARRRAPGSESV